MIITLNNREELKNSSKMSVIKLVSSDNRTFAVDAELLQCSGFLKDFALTSEPDDAIPLPLVSGFILEKILAWAVHQVDSGQVDENNDEATSQWEKEFFKLDPDTLLELAEAANYLDIKGLINDLSYRIAENLNSKSLNEIYMDCITNIYHSM